MGQQIIKQPNGLYAVFSSITDTIIMWNFTADDLIEYYVKEARKRITRDVQDTIAELNAGGKPYYQFTMTWTEALKTSRRSSNMTREEVQKIIADTKAAE